MSQTYKEKLGELSKLQIIFNQNRLDRGAKSEQTIANALDKLIEEEFILSWWTADEHAEKIDGTDFFVLRKEDAITIPIQVKSSETGKRDHFERHPDVPCVVNHVGDSEENIINALKIIVNIFPTVQH